jgi:hypothetical protein
MFPLIVVGLFVAMVVVLSLLPSRFWRTHSALPAVLTYFGLGALVSFVLAGWAVFRGVTRHTDADFGGAVLLSMLGVLATTCTAMVRRRRPRAPGSSEPDEPSL